MPAISEIGPGGGTIQIENCLIEFPPNCVEEKVSFKVSIKPFAKDTNQDFQETTLGFCSYLCTPTLTLSTKVGQKKQKFVEPITVTLPCSFKGKESTWNARPRLYDCKEWKYIDNVTYDGSGFIQVQTDEWFKRINVELLALQNDDKISKRLNFYGVCDFTSCPDCYELNVHVEDSFGDMTDVHLQATCFEMCLFVRRHEVCAKLELSSDDVEFLQTEWDFNVKNSYFEPILETHTFQMLPTRPFLPLKAKCEIQTRFYGANEGKGTHSSASPRNVGSRYFCIERSEPFKNKYDFISETTSPIGPKGGNIHMKGSNFGLKAPENAFSEKKNVTLRLLKKKERKLRHTRKIEAIKDTNDQDSLEVTPVLQCLPSRISFEKELSVTLPLCFSFPSEEPLVLLPQTNDGNGWEDLEEITLTEPVESITFPITSFSFKRVIIARIKSMMDQLVSKTLYHVCYRNENPTPFASLRWDIGDLGGSLKQAEHQRIAFRETINVKWGQSIVMMIAEDDRAVSRTKVQNEQLLVPGVIVEKSIQLSLQESDLWHFPKKLSYTIRCAKTRKIIANGDFTFPFAKNHSLELSRRQPHTHKYRNKLMISYNWSDSSLLAEKVYSQLTIAGYKVWFDKTDMYGDKFEAMSKAVDESNIFLMFVSPKYETSRDYRKEAEYADDKNKKIIPIRSTSGYQPKGWLALMEAGKIYYDFGTLEFGDVFERLCSEISRS